MDKGAHFYRCDFQVHTPRDANWVGSRPASPEDRRDFADRLVATCRSKGIGAIAITDHHDFAYVPFVKDAAAAERAPDGKPFEPEQRLVVFPGLELTLGVPCQALLIFDADFPVDRLSVALEALAIDAVDPDERGLPSTVQRVEHIQSFKQLHDDLDHHTWLKDHYIVLPNVTDGGHATLMRPGMAVKYKEMPCVGGYLDGTIAQIGEGNRRIFGGLDVAWGSKRLAVFQTSDSRNESFTDLGEPSTWVKWATPTAEALRQACLAEESRVAHELPSLPSVYVTRVSVSNSKFMGPIELELNPQYNAFIGGRGTGKSTCLEYVRWALCDQPVGGGPEDEFSDHAARRQHLIATTLAPFESHVDVHFLLNGIAHVVRRHAATNEILLRVGGGDFVPAHEDDVQSLLPIQAYSQKQLSSVSVRVNELTRFVTAAIRGRLEQIDARAADIAGETRENYAALQRHRTLTAAIRRAEISTASLQQQAANVRDSLGAVSDEDRGILARKPAQDVADELTVAWERKVEQASDEVRAFRSRLVELRRDIKPLPDQELPERRTLQGIEAAVRAVYDELEAASDRMDALVTDARAEGSSHANLAASWQAARAEFDSSYAAATTRSAAHQSKLAELTELEQRGREVREALDRQREELARLGDPAAEHARLRSEWLAIQEERSNCLAEQCRSLTELSAGLIRATLKRGAGLRSQMEGFRAAVAGSGVRGTKIEGFFDGLVQDDDPVGTWERALSELETKATNGETDGTVAVPTLTRLGYSHSDIDKMAERLSPDAWLVLALQAVEDHPTFDYQTKEGEYIDFSDASPGQQATALLRVLLNQGGTPLIIDQPEDDLDSQIVLEVVEQIWTAKKQRQLIFSSHNANLVVNGDAELVVCCDYRAAGDHSGGRIKLEGAIDVDEVRSEITVVMEGGEKAFRLRKDKYGF